MMTVADSVADDTIAAREEAEEWAEYSPFEDEEDEDTGEDDGDDGDDGDGDDVFAPVVIAPSPDLIAAANRLATQLARYVLELIVREANDDSILRRLNRALAPSTPAAAGDDLIERVVEPIDAEAEALQRALHAAVVLPWPMRADAAELLPRWRRLRLLEVLGALSDDERRELHEHSFKIATSDERGSLYWRSLPRLGGDRVVCVYGRPERVKIDGVERLVRVARMPDWMLKVERDLRKKRKVAEAARRKSASRVTRHEGGTHPYSDGTRQGQGARSGEGTATRTLGGATPGALQAPPLAPTGTGMSPSLMSCDSRGENDASRAMPPTVTVDLPVSLLARRTEIGDRGLYVCHLLWRTRRVEDEDARSVREGWRPLAQDLLRFELGESRVDGKRIVWAAHLMGSRTAPGLLERLGIIERRAGYAAGAGHAQRYRLCSPYAERSQRTERVTLVMRARVDAEHQGPRGPEVHGWLISSYGQLELGYFEALADLCDRAGVPRTASADELSATIAALPKPRKGKDQRGAWQAELRLLRDWAVPESARMHDLRRSETNGRLVSPFASLPGRHRRHMRLAGERVVSIDIVAAQFASICAMLRADAVEGADEFCAMCAREDVYLHLYKLAHGAAPRDREQAKTETARDVLYGGADVLESSPMGRAMLAHYPAVHAWLVAAKAGVRGPSVFARRVQAAEARLVLELLPPRLAAAGIHVATVHDAVYAPASRADEAERIFAAVLTENRVPARLRREEML